MRLQLGGAIRPNNESVASISYSPVYDITRVVTSMRERWDIAGRIVLQTNASQQQMTAEIEKLKRDFDQGVNNNIVYLEDLTNRPTALKINVADCLLGPYVVDSSFPNQNDDVYATGMGYRVVFECVRYVANGSGLLAFEENFDNTEPGGTEIVWVGGSVNYPEQQIGTQYKAFRYTQSGSATGLFAYPAIPPCLFPFASTRWSNGQPLAKITKQSPKVLGRVDTEFQINWEYEMAWHLPLNGTPHRR